jgi:hypothetical protein
MRLAASADGIPCFAPPRGCSQDWWDRHGHHKESEDEQPDPDRVRAAEHEKLETT